MQKLRLLILIASCASASSETGSAEQYDYIIGNTICARSKILYFRQNTEEAELRQPKLFYVSSATTTTTISTQTVSNLFYKWLIYKWIVLGSSIRFILDTCQRHHKQCLWRNFNLVEFFFQFGQN